jgi:DNA polymerase III subunit chi
VSDAGRVDFYILTAADSAARLRFACRLAEKAYHLQHRVHLHTESPAAAAEVDDLLWTFRHGSFVPHEIARPGQASASPVTIGYGADRPPGADLLVNLAADLPEFSAEFPRVAEIVEDSEPARQLGRERFRRYKQGGRETVTHTIGGAP